MNRSSATSPPPAAGVHRAIGFLAAAALLVVAAGTWSAMTPDIVYSSAGSAAVRLEPAFIAPDEMARLIAGYEARVADHTDALDHRALGGLYLEDARVSGDVRRYEQASAAFETALGLFPGDGDSRLGAARAAFGLHRFEDALSGAAQVSAALPERFDAQLLVVDALLALGRYEEARPALDRLAATVGVEQPAILVRRSTMARVDGTMREAIALASQASDLVDLPAARKAWFEAFAAQTALDLGDPGRAGSYAGAAIGHDPSSPAVMVTAARVEAAAGRHHEAIALYESAIEKRPDPGYFAELGDLHSLVGASQAAADAYAVVDAAARLAASSGVHDRAIARSLADRRVDVERAVQMARRDVESREDIDAWDTLAWTLFAAGENEEARLAADRALAAGGPEPRHLYHSAMIDLGRGDLEAAARQLDAALASAGGLSPLDQARAAEARKRLS
jgi:tetratricopeptide (TPR) repeat protein